MQPFITDHLLFWVLMYTLALTAWLCMGRFLMQAIVPVDSPNYIWRGFRLTTDWAMWLARRAVPSYVSGLFLPLVAAFWLFGIRMVLGIVLLAAGLGPSISGGAGPAP